jgi:hypothetical protein
MEVCAMSHEKQTSKRRIRAKAVTVLGVAGALSLASWAAVSPAGDTPTKNTAPVISLGDEEISNVSLATFYVFDNKNVGANRPGLQLARQRGHGGSRGSVGYRSGGGYSVYGGYGGGYGGGGPTGAGGPDGM